MDFIEKRIPKKYFRPIKKILAVVLILTALGTFLNIEIITKIIGKITAQVIMIIAGYFLWINS